MSVLVNIPVILYGRAEAYHSRVNKSSPVISILEKSQNERYCARSEENQDELVLELLEN